MPSIPDGAVRRRNSEKTLSSGATSFSPWHSTRELPHRH
jgi:hypothetical protein